MSETIGMKPTNFLGGFMVIGLMGGVGSGKSTVLDYLEKNYNAYIIQSDIVAKEIMKKGYEAYDIIRENFGECFDGEKINRDKLAKVVFEDENWLKLLNSITHPATVNEIIKRVNNAQNEDMIIVESALLVESGLHKICTDLWYVYCDEKKRVERLIDNRGYSREKAYSIINNQPREEDYNSLADEFIDNSYDIGHTKEQIDLLLSMMECSF